MTMLIETFYGRSFGFSSCWVTLVMSVVSSFKYIYQVNGDRSRRVIPHSGLRQGAIVSLPIHYDL